MTTVREVIEQLLYCDLDAEAVVGNEYVDTVGATDYVFQDIYARGGRAKIQGRPDDGTFPLRRAENGR